MAKKIDLNGLDHFKEKENAMIASEYSSSKTYAVGDYVYYAGTLYVCTTAITTAEAWTAGHWTAAKLADDCSALKTALAVLEPSATSADVGKALIAKTVEDGVVTEYEFGEAGGGGASAIVNSVENVPIASFDDGTASAVKQIVVGIEPYQAGSGDASPENQRPIYGWTGANIFKTGKNMLSYTPSRLTNAQAVQFDITRATLLKANETYKMSFAFENATTWRIGAVIFDLSGNRYYNPDVNIIGTEYERNDSGQYYVWNGNYSLTESNILPVIDCYIMLFFLLGDTSESTVMKNVQLEIGSTVTEYEEYNGTTYSLTFPTEAGTVYGGTLTNLGTDEWKLRVTYEITVQNGGFTKHPSFETRFYKYSAISGAAAGTCFSNMFKYTTATLAQLAGNEFTVDTTYTRIAVNASGFTTEEAFNTFLATNNLVIAYPLATPVEYTFTTSEVIKLLSGYNNVWADTGNINLLEYYADSKTYIDEENALVKALIAKELPSMVADTALTANDFRIVNNTLYRITTSVASGATLTPNTNCTATTITAVLKSLLS